MEDLITIKNLEQFKKAIVDEIDVCIADLTLKGDGYDRRKTNLIKTLMGTYEHYMSVHTAINQNQESDGDDEDYIPDSDQDIPVIKVGPIVERIKNRIQQTRAMHQASINREDRDHLDEKDTDEKLFGDCTPTTSRRISYLNSDSSDDDLAADIILNRKPYLKVKRGNVEVDDDRNMLLARSLGSNKKVETGSSNIIELNSDSKLESYD